MFTKVLDPRAYDPIGHLILGSLTLGLFLNHIIILLNSTHSHLTFTSHNHKDPCSIHWLSDRGKMLPIWRKRSPGQLRDRSHDGGTNPVLMNYPLKPMWWWTREIRHVTPCGKIAWQHGSTTLTKAICRNVHPDCSLWTKTQTRGPHIQNLVLLPEPIFNFFKVFLFG